MSRMAISKGRPSLSQDVKDQILELFAQGNSPADVKRLCLPVGQTKIYELHRMFQAREIESNSETEKAGVTSSGISSEAPEGHVDCTGSTLPDPASTTQDIPGRKRQ